MKHSGKLIVLVSGLLAFSTNMFAYTGTGSLAVSATVQGSCTIGGGTLAFGAYDPTSNTDLQVNTPIALTCANGASVTLSLGAGANAVAGIRELKSTTKTGSFLTYGVYSDSNASVAWGDGTAATGSAATVVYSGTGSSSPINVYGKIAAHQSTAVASNDYMDTIVITASF